MYKLVVSVATLSTCIPSSLGSWKEMITVNFYLHFPSKYTVKKILVFLGHPRCGWAYFSQIFISQASGVWGNLISECRCGQVLSRGFFAGLQMSAFSSCPYKTEKELWALLLRTGIPPLEFYSRTLYESNCISKAPLPNVITLGLRLQQNLWESQTLRS